MSFVATKRENSCLWQDGVQEVLVLNDLTVAQGTSEDIFHTVLWTGQFKGKLSASLKRLSSSTLQELSTCIFMALLRIRLHRDGYPESSLSCTFAHPTPVKATCSCSLPRKKCTFPSLYKTLNCQRLSIHLTVSTHGGRSFIDGTTSKLMGLNESVHSSQSKFGA